MARPPSADSILRNIKKQGRREIKILDKSMDTFHITNLSGVQLGAKKGVRNDITVNNIIVTADNNTGDKEYVAMVLHGTDATPPTPSNFPRGTIYIQYTA